MSPPEIITARVGRPFDVIALRRYGCAVFVAMRQAYLPSCARWRGGSTPPAAP
jgi:hypothetical protein